VRSRALATWAMIRVPQPALRHADRFERTQTMANTASSLDDLQLVARIGRGDVAAFRELSGRELARITRFAARMLGDAIEAEDVAQETFLRLWTAASRFEPRAKPSTWLFSIAHNLCVDRLRKRRPRANSELDQLPSEQRPSDALSHKQTAERVQRALADLPERQRTAIALVHYEGLGNLEAAQVMNVGVEALESLLARGRRSLREALRDTEGNDP
jgi:RNA polymerase sigma-70 factor, ECF subfamily